MLTEGGEQGIIPAEYKTNLLEVMHTLRQMKDNADSEWITKTSEVAVMIADSAMFQRICPVEGGDDSPEFSSFFGLALPLLKGGIAARPVQLDNVKRFAGYLDAYKTMILSYEFMKPQSPDINGVIANWVKNGGTLVYVGDGSDPFMNIREWWNTGLGTYSNPAEHLFESLGLTRTPEEGLHSVGSGRVLYIKTAPKLLAENAEKSDEFLAKITELIGAENSSELVLRRGSYYITAVMDETERSEKAELKGTYVNLYDHTLPVIEDPELEVGSVGLWFDLSRIDKSENASIIALSGRAASIKVPQRALNFTVMSPTQMNAAARIWTKRPPKSVKVTVDKVTTDLPFEYEPDSETTYFVYPASETDAKVSVSF